jgi:hypothetical protein
MTNDTRTLTSQVPSSQCPYCDQVYDVTTSVGGKRSPLPGDWAVCYNCAQFLVYDGGLKVRKPYQGEVAGMTQRNPKARELLDRAAATVRQRDRRSL